MSLEISKCPMQIGEKIGGRFEVVDAGRQGGMAWVVKAKDTQTGKICAVKIPRLDGDQELNALAFERECKALNRLHHENIVQFIDAGRDESGANFLAIEWLHQNLSDKIQSNPPWDWESFYVDIGRPLLVALSHAHLQGIAHRDLKPDNLLFDAFDTVKICDFGIATAASSLNFGRTLRHAGSVPYTPPESDDGVRSPSRDSYSWAVVATSCLSGKLFLDLGSFHSSLHSLDHQRNPTTVLQKAASVESSKRYLSAVDLLVETDAFHKKITDQQQITVALDLSGKALRLVAANWPNTEPAELALLVQKDVNATHSAQFIESEVEQKIRLVGANLEVICRKVSPESPAFRVEEINILGMERAEMMRRDMSSIPGVYFFVCDYQSALKYAKQLRMFEMRLRVAESELERDLQRRTRERWLDCWSAFLQKKESYGREMKEKYHYTHMQRDGFRYYATCDGELDADTIGDSLIILRDNGHLLLFRVLDVLEEQIVLELQGNYHELVPMRGGVLESNHVASRQAILRQKSALEMIKRDAAVSPNLKSILCDSSTSQLPEMSGLPQLSVSLSADKHEILERALGTKDVLAIEGPPGTGKTTLISELISIYLRCYPTHKVLVSSQTHTALDHVISKLVSGGLGDLVVRIHSDRASKVDQAILPLTLEQKVKVWREKVEERARKFLSERGSSLGLNHMQVEGMILKGQRALLINQVNALTLLLEKVNETVSSTATAASTKKVKEDKEDLLDQTTTALDQAANLLEQIKELKKKKDRLDEQLSQKEYLQKDEETISSGCAVPVGDLATQVEQSPSSKLFFKLVELQLGWLARLGVTKDFYPAVLGEARVVAGTCIGLGAVLPGIQEKFDLCVIDEVSKATVTETLVPMAHSKRWILVGDPRQLPPFFESSEITSISGFSEEEVKATVLDIFLRGLPPQCKGKLVEQRRMAAGIGDLISEVFYKKELTTIRSDGDRNKVIRKLFPKPVVWYSTSRNADRQEEEQPGRTFRNLGECHLIAGLLQHISRGFSKPDERVHVAVIAAYSAQVRALKYQLSSINSSLPNITYEVNTVDAFQGRDADICIYSVTRSNDLRKLGFQREEPRLNVALSRGRDALLIVGDEGFCRSVHVRNPFLDVLAFVDSNPKWCEVAVYERH